MNTELLEALNILEKEKDISKETLLDAIENSLINACKNHFGKADNIRVIMNRETCLLYTSSSLSAVPDVFTCLPQAVVVCSNQNKLILDIFNLNLFPIRWMFINNLLLLRKYLVKNGLL